MVYWNTTEVVCALIGGLLIALSTTLNLYYYGRITGLSGIFNTIIKHDTKAGFLWKYCFMIGLVTPPVLLYLIFGNDITIGSLTLTMFDTNTTTLFNLNTYGWVVGGILVGWGTRMGNGCTSGHGVCGLPRLSPRSFAATATFMGFGFLVATTRHYVPFMVNATGFSASIITIWRYIFIVVLILGNLFALLLVILNRLRSKEIV
jgi:uncharacterized membrane protein YedE/YeeE